MCPAGKKFDVLGFTRPKTTTSSPGEPEQLPGFGVFAPWLGGLAGWLAGGWWFSQREMTQVELLEMKARELRNGRLAMWVAHDGGAGDAAAGLGSCATEGSQCGWCAPGALGLGVQWT